MADTKKKGENQGQDYTDDEGQKGGQSSDTGENQGMDNQNLGDEEEQGGM